MAFISEFKEFLLQNWDNPSSFTHSIENKKKKAKIYYTYRLTYQETGNNTKQYYMGYRGCTTHPFLDEYYSSSDLVKQLKRQHGSKCFKKKILGIYLTNN